MDNSYDLSVPLPDPYETVRWHWFIECQDCGRIHLWRWLPTPEHVPKRGTWAAEEDGHVYRPRMRQTEIAKLYNEHLAPIRDSTSAPPQILPIFDA